jgi:ferredoxin/flavodoxin---NADP+ reductase
VPCVTVNQLLNADQDIEVVPEDTHFLLCGNPRMVEDLIDMLGAAGFREHRHWSPGQVHVERYW